MHPSSKSNAVTVDEVFEAQMRPLDTSIDDLRRRFAGNDPNCGDTPAAERLSSYTLHQAARTTRAFVLVALAAAGMRRVRGWVDATRARRKRQREAKAIYEALDQLDARTLRDLGFDRFEIGSVAAEATGQAEVTRVRVHQMLYLR